MALFLAVVVIGGIFTLIVPSLLSSYIHITGVDSEAIRSLSVIVFGYFALQLLNNAIISYGQQKPRVDEKSVVKVVSLIGYIILIAVILSISKINFTGALVGAGFLGIVIGLASQSTLGNFFAGVSMMAAKPFASGDRITFSTWQYGMMPPSYPHHAVLPGYSGVIEDIGLMYTKIKLDEGPVIFVPNGVINQAVIINYSISKAKDVIVRVELVKRKFSAFKREIENKVHAERELDRMIKSPIEIIITDIGISNYGVRLKATVPMNNEAYATDKLSSIVLDISKKFQS